MRIISYMEYLSGELKIEKGDWVDARLYDIPSVVEKGVSNLKRRGAEKVSIVKEGKYEWL